MAYPLSFLKNFYGNDKTKRHYAGFYFYLLQVFKYLVQICKGNYYKFLTTTLKKADLF